MAAPLPFVDQVVSYVQVWAALKGTTSPLLHTLCNKLYKSFNYFMNYSKLNIN